MDPTLYFNICSVYITLRNWYTSNTISDNVIALANIRRNPTKTVKRLLLYIKKKKKKNGQDIYNFVWVYSSLHYVHNNIIHKYNDSIIILTLL